MKSVCLQLAMEPPVLLEVEGVEHQKYPQVNKVETTGHSGSGWDY